MAACTFLMGKLLSAFQKCLSWRRKREFVMNALLDDYYFAALIKIVRKIHSECRKLSAATMQSDMITISRIVVDELSPTAAQADCYNGEAIAKAFGEEMHEKIDAFLDVCLYIDCSTAPGAAVPISRCDIEPSCTRAEMLWDEIVDIYMRKSCPLGWFGKSVKKKMLELHIKRAVPRAFPYPTNVRKMGGEGC